MAEAHPPGPDGGLFGSKLAAAMRCDPAAFATSLHRQYGDVVRFQLGPFPCYQLCHPEHVNQVLVQQAGCFQKTARFKQVFGRFEGNGLIVSDGPLWHRQRQRVQPAFHPDRLTGYADTIAGLAGEQVDRWSAGDTIEFQVAMRRLTIRVVVRTLFSSAVDAEVDRLAAAVDVIQHWAMRQLHRVVAWPRWLPLLGRPRKAIATVHGLVDHWIRQRRTKGDSPDDLLNHLLAAVDGAGHGPPMDDRQLRDEMVTLLLAGHETSTAMLTWTGWLLATHGEFQDELAQQVRQAIGQRTVAAGDLPELYRVEQVLKESMRLYPPVYLLSREASESVIIGGYRLEPGSQVFLSPYVTGRDPRWFSDPERFAPGRFEPEQEARLPRGAYFPFGIGPRACPARSFALMEGTVILASLLQRFRLRLAPTQRPPERQWQLSLQPRGGLKLVLEQ